MKVSCMTSNRSGRAVANQFQVIDDDGNLYFQSYRSIIAKKVNGKITLDKYRWNYSPTTSKYRNQFLGETKKETEAKIKSGEYTLADLN